ncbi:MAG: hypothetical protein ACSLFE_01400 [Gemmatimonadaceae bacterium]
MSFTAALGLRAAGIWAGVRTMVALFGSLAGIPLFPSAPRDVILIVLVVAALAALELRRRRELLFFANLGIAPEALMAFGGAIALLLELALVAAKAVWP